MKKTGPATIHLGQYKSYFDYNLPLREHSFLPEGGRPSICGGTRFFWGGLRGDHFFVTGSKGMGPEVVPEFFSRGEDQNFVGAFGATC